MSTERNADQHAAASPTGVPSLDQPAEGTRDPGDLTEMLQELRVLIPGVQMLTGFLVIVPFSLNFHGISLAEKGVYLSAFVCGLVSLILFSAPAAQHRIERPLRDRVRFKQFATRMTIIGLVPLSLALVLTTQLVVAQTVGEGIAFVVTGCVAALLVAVWWVWPLRARRASRAHGWPGSA